MTGHLDHAQHCYETPGSSALKHELSSTSIMEVTAETVQLFCILSIATKHLRSSAESAYAGPMSHEYQWP